ncbi:hypothetical protein IGI39_000359 [Enterococcus sp. AZ135]|uniref:hypothetical protein n=1 Tax=unclassified Enterococcus TaxID=2608891 RepID=UPI003F23C96D
MDIVELFNRMMGATSGHLGNIYFITGIIAILCIAGSIYLRMKKYRYAKWVTLTGCLLLINPVLYLFFN